MVKGPSNYRMNLTVHASRALLGSAPLGIPPQGGAQGARHASRRLSRRWAASRCASLEHLG